jgi:hypothetical protein
MKSVILASTLVLPALACCTIPASAGACPGNPVWCTFSRGPIGPTSFCRPYVCPDTPQDDPHRISGSWVVRREGQPFSNPDSTMIIDVWGQKIVVRGAGWSGRGSFDGVSGRYDWSFPDGRTGVTTFTINYRDSTLHLHARGSDGRAWDWMASRR